LLGGYEDQISVRPGFGRRTIINNPDTGRTETQYDLASNVTKKITANLQAQAKFIDYAYDFNRLTAITYRSAESF